MDAAFFVYDLKAKNMAMMHEMIKMFLKPIRRLSKSGISG